MCLFLCQYHTVLITLVSMAFGSTRPIGRCWHRLGAWVTESPPGTWDHWQPPKLCDGPGTCISGSQSRDLDLWRLPQYGNKGGSWVCGHWYRDWLCEGSGTGAGYEPRTARDHLGPGVLGAYLVLVWVGSLASQKLVVLVQAWCWGPRSEVKWKVFPL